ncbi:uncharacterized protein [Dysidea avara]|uniref:uncharacterized protein isoform X1 n=1 Tax=Dysidea avara TaxID=196820 RepID=UPI00332AC586
MTSLLRKVVSRKNSSDDHSSQLTELHGVSSTGKELGVGAYGRVLEVCVHGTTRAAAKEIHSILVDSVTPAEGTITKQKFLDECRISSRIRHPNVVEVLGIHYPAPNKLPWLVMELMETSLTDFLEKCEKDKISLHTKLSILIDISQGLEFLHGQNIVHRDLSSNNVLLTECCVAKVADLGVAKIIDSSKMSSHSQAPGTIYFMPPEALTDKPYYGIAVDVFSLGCVACHIVSHRWPAPKNQLTEVLRREDYLQLFSQSSLRQLTELCLQDDPKKRPRISEVCGKLKDLKKKHLLRFSLSQVTNTGKEIGKGTYGRVIEVCVYGTLCAAKEVHATLVTGITLAEFEVVKQSFFTECINASRVLHPNVVQVLGIHYPTPEPKLPWLVMEKMELSLTNFMNRYEKDGIPLYFKLSILADISQGLEFLHGQDIIHGQLFSNNVLLTKHCVAKIADLGVAKAIHHSRPKIHTETPGTLPFIPPEAMSIETRYNKPVDVFSLGCVSCHVMSHQWPQLKDLHGTGTEVQRREEYLKSCAEPSLRKVVESCLNNSPEKRPKISSISKELNALKDKNNENLPLAAQSRSGFVDLVNYVKSEGVNVTNFHEELSAKDKLLKQKEEEIKQLQAKLMDALLSKLSTCDSSTTKRQSLTRPRAVSRCDIGPIGDPHDVRHLLSASTDGTVFEVQQEKQHISNSIADKNTTAEKANR